MDIIQFRGKCQRTGKWVYGYLCSKDVIKPEKGSRLKVDPETVGQYLNVIDKNHKKVFIGDEVLLKGIRGGCYDSKDKIVTMLSLSSSTYLFQDGYDYREMEIIGAMHDKGEEF